MEKKVKLSKDWKGHKAGAILEVDPTTFDEIIAAGVGVEYDATKEGEAQKKKDDERKELETAVSKVLDDKLKPINDKMSKIEVHDKSDDDPLWGYGDKNKSEKELSREEILFAAGLFFRDLSLEKGGPPERLQKCHERGLEVIQKAAGDGMVVGEDEYGGYMIFPAAMQMINQETVETAMIRPRASRFNLTTQILEVPLMRDENRTNGQLYMGIRCFWEDELDQSTSSRPKMRKMAWKLKKLTCLGYASEEWIKWAPETLGSWFVPKFGQAIGYTEDIAFINGKGGGQPLGLLNAGCKIDVTKESGQVADTFVLENTTAMFARLRLVGGINIAWLMNQTVFPQLPLMNVAVGTGGSAVFINSAQDRPGQSLWGYPIQYTEKVPVLGDAGDVILANLADYVVADDQAGPIVAQSIHFKFDYGQTAIRVHKYVDGQNLTDTAFTPYQAGSTAAATLSPVVTLEERA